MPRGAPPGRLCGRRSVQMLLQGYFPFPYFCGMNIQRMQVSIFLHVWEKGSEVIFLEEFINDVRGARWAVLALSHRKMLVEGRLKEAAKLKADLMAVIVAGVFKGGHAAAQVSSLSGLMMVDFDHTNERTRETVLLLSQLPYVVAAFVSISGQGLKVIVRVDVESAAQYAMVYPVVASQLSGLAHFQCDGKCSDLGRPCFVSHDPEAYYNPDAEVFPWQGRVPQQAVVPVSGPVLPAQATDALPSAGGFMQGFLVDFERRNSFEKGKRNDFLLKLGRVARHKEFSVAEFRSLVHMCIQRYAGEEVSASDVDKRLTSGYQFVDSGRGAISSAPKSHQSQGSPAVAPDSSDLEQEEQEMLRNNEILRRQLPCFPDELFEHLPPLLAQGVALARSSRERDMLLMGMLANISGCLPGVQILYDQMYCSMHFYFIAIAHAGGGKGVLALASLLPGAIHRHYEGLNRQATREYKEALQRWELEQKQAARAKRVADLSLCPEAPRMMMLKVSPNISKSRLIIYLEDNGKLGVIINATELDMVSGAIRQDCGKHDDVFRAAFQHEEVSSDYKVDGRQVMAHEPHLACCFAGTPEQLPAFVASLENGLFSRINLYAGEAVWEWRPAAPRPGAKDHRAVFNELSERLLEMHLFLAQSPTEVVFTPQQWEEHTRRFGGWLSAVVGQKEDSPGAIVLRHGLVTMRIAGILTALRKCECAFTMLEYRCTDEDFQTAMQLIEVLMEHSLLLSSSLPSTNKRVRPLKAYFRLAPVLDQLKQKFTYQEFMQEVHRQQFPDSTAKRLLSKAVLDKMIDKEEDGYRKKKK